MSKERPIRILQVVGGMNRGGVETWLMHVLRHIDRERFQMDFLVHTEKPCAYDDEIRALGSRIIPCMHPKNPLQYALNFRRVLREYGPYDVVHSHVYLYSGFILFLARKQGVNISIASIYPTKDGEAPQRTYGWRRNLYRKVMTNSIVNNATQILFDSSQAKDMFVSLIGRDLSRLQVLYCGIDLSPFQEPVSIEKIRAELNVTLDQKLVITVARYVPHKNHQHLVEIARRVAVKRDDVIFLLVGDGPLYSEIEELVKDVGLTDKFRFVKSVANLAPLYKSADLFLFTSKMEGFGLVVVEAAASGLPIVASDIPGIWDSSKSSASPILIKVTDTDGFVNAVLEGLAQPKEKSKPNLSLLAPFDIATSLNSLLSIYEGIKVLRY